MFHVKWHHSAMQVCPQGPVRMEPFQMYVFCSSRTDPHRVEWSCRAARMGNGRERAGVSPELGQLPSFQRYNLPTGSGGGPGKSIPLPFLISSATIVCRNNIWNAFFALAKSNIWNDSVRHMRVCQHWQDLADHCKKANAGYHATLLLRCQDGSL